MQQMASLSMQWGVRVAGAKRGLVNHERGKCSRSALLERAHQRGLVVHAYTFRNEVRSRRNEPLHVLRLTGRASFEGDCAWDRLSEHAIPSGRSTLWRIGRLGWAPAACSPGALHGDRLCGGPAGGAGALWAPGRGRRVCGLPGHRARVAGGAGWRAAWHAWGRRGGGRLILAACAAARAGCGVPLQRRAGLHGYCRQPEHLHPPAHIG
jgi:hypothetical protein